MFKTIRENKAAALALLVTMSGTFFLGGVAIKSGSTTHCREVVMRDIIESRRYQGTLDQMLRPDWIEELEKGTAK